MLVYPHSVMVQFSKRFVLLPMVDCSNILSMFHIGLLIELNLA